MAFAGRCGLEIELGSAGGAETVAALFAEELGGVIQIRAADETRVMQILGEAGIASYTRAIGRVCGAPMLLIYGGQNDVIPAADSTTEADDPQMQPAAVSAAE